MDCDVHLYNLHNTYVHIFSIYVDKCILTYVTICTCTLYNVFVDVRKKFLSFQICLFREGLPTLEN